MANSVDLLLITRNRPHYLKRTLTQLFQDDSDFRIYWWDNGSDPELVEWVQSLDEPRIVMSHQATENIGQLEPTYWFLEHAESDVAGKIDDDILLPQGWTQTLAEIVRSNPQAGMLASWIFMPKDYRDKWAQRYAIKLGDHKVLRNVAVQGQSCLARTELLRRYADNYRGGFPIDQVKMTADGYINGFPLPIQFGHNMDDPRSEYYVPATTEFGSPSSFTAHKLCFPTIERYVEWIEADARERQLLPFFIQHLLVRSKHIEGLAGKILERISAMLVRSNGIIWRNFRE